MYNIINNAYIIGDKKFYWDKNNEYLIDKDGTALIHKNDTEIGYLHISACRYYGMKPFRPQLKKQFNDVVLED